MLKIFCPSGATTREPHINMSQLHDLCSLFSSWPSTISASVHKHSPTFHHSHAYHRTSTNYMLNMREGSLFVYTGWWTWKAPDFTSGMGKCMEYLHGDFQIVTHVKCHITRKAGICICKNRIGRIRGVPQHNALSTIWSL